MKILLQFLTLIAALNLTAACWAQDKATWSAQAAAYAAKLRASGEPKNRCSIGAFIVDGPTISRVFAITSLVPGDRLISLNHIDVSTMGVEGVISLLRGIDPLTTLQATVERKGARVDLQIACTNARASTTAMLVGLDMFVAGRYDDCVSAFSDGADFGTAGAAFRLECAAVSKNTKRYDLGQLAYEAMRFQVEDAAWTPATRKDVINRLRGTEGVISKDGNSARYQKLVTLTQGWGGDESAYAKSEPDWGRFRQAAEGALLGRLVDPESAKIEWPYGFLYGSWKPGFAKRLDGYWTCGTVNARNRMGGYTGSTFFVAVLDRDGAVQYVDMGSGKEFDFLSTQCKNSVKMLPPPPVQLASQRSTVSPGAIPSMADELKKLAELRASGALNDAEFQTAKAKLIGGKTF